MNWLTALQLVLFWPIALACSDGEVRYFLATYSNCVNGNFVYTGCTQMMNNGTDARFAVGTFFEEPGSKKFECIVPTDGQGIPLANEVACVDNEGNLIQAGEKKLQKDGTTITCTRISEYTLRRDIFTPGKTQTKSIVRNILYEIDDTGNKVAKGCTPNNDGNTISVGQTEVLRGVRFACKQVDEQMVFQPEGCVSQSGKDMAVGAKNSLPDGATESCVQDKEKIVYFANTAKGCRLANGKYVRVDAIYQEGKSLVEDGKSLTYYVNYRCTRSSNILALTPVGCDIGQEGSIGYGEMTTIGQKTYSCQLAAADTLYVESINAEEASCNIGGKTYRHGDELFDTFNTTIYRCDKGQLVKTGCWAKGKRFVIGDTFYCADDGFYCPAAGTGPTYVGEGCLVGTELIHYKKAHTFPDGEYRCSYKITVIGTRPYWEPEACTYKQGSIGLGAYQQDGAKWYYCGYSYRNKTLYVRELTPEETNCAENSIKGLINENCINQHDIEKPPKETDHIPPGQETPKGPPNVPGISDETSTEQPSVGSTKGPLKKPDTADSKTDSPDGPHNGGKTDSPDGPHNGGKTDSPDGPHNGGKTDGPDGPHDGKTDGPDGPHDGKTDGPDGPHDGKTDGPDGPHDGKTDGPDGPHDGKTDGPDGPHDGKTDGPDGPHDGKTDGLDGPHDGKTDGPDGPHDGQTDGPDGPHNGGKTDGPDGPHNGGKTDGPDGPHDGKTDGPDGPHDGGKTDGPDGPHNGGKTDGPDGPHDGKTDGPDGPHDGKTDGPDGPHNGGKTDGPDGPHNGGKTDGPDGPHDGGKTDGPDGPHDGQTDGPDGPHNGGKTDGPDGPHDGGKTDGPDGPHDGGKTDGPDGPHDGGKTDGPDGPHDGGKTDGPDGPHDGKTDGPDGPHDGKTDGPDGPHDGKTDGPDGPHDGQTDGPDGPHNGGKTDGPDGPHDGGKTDGPDGPHDGGKTDGPDGPHDGGKTDGPDGPHDGGKTDGPDGPHDGGKTDGPDGPHNGGKTDGPDGPHDGGKTDGPDGPHNGGKTDGPDGPHDGGKTDGPDGPHDGKTDGPDGPHNGGKTDGPDGPHDGKTDGPDGPHDGKTDGPDGPHDGGKTDGPDGPHNGGKTDGPDGPHDGKTDGPDGPHDGKTDGPDGPHDGGKTDGPDGPHNGGKTDGPDGPEVPGVPGEGVSKNPNVPQIPGVPRIQTETPAPREHTLGRYSVPTAAPEVKGPEGPYCCRVDKDKLCHDVCKMLAPHCAGSMLESLLGELPVDLEAIRVSLKNAASSGADLPGLLEGIAATVNISSIAPRKLSLRIKDYVEVVTRDRIRGSDICQSYLQGCFHGDQKLCSELSSSECVAADVCPNTDGCDSCSVSKTLNPDMETLVKYLCPGTCAVSDVELNINIEELILSSAGRLGALGLPCAPQASHLSRARDESLPMTSSLRYEPVEGERLEFEPEIYGSDDTTQIFGDDSRIPIGLREILVDPRLNPSKRIFCCGAASSLIVILSVVFLFIIGGYFHVQSEIKERAVIAKNGLDLLPKPKSDGAWIMFLNFKTEADKYVNALKNATEEYEKEQNSRVNLTRDCEPKDRPNEKKWCRFPLKKKFMRAGKGCSFDENKFGYSSQSPCVLISLRDTIGWAPVFSNNSRAKNDIPLKCVVLDTFKFYDEHINISYYPAHDLNANYGAFSLNKLPSLAIKTADGSEICDENGETLNDMASLLFVKFHLPPGFKHGLVHCTLVNNLEGAAITNLNTFKGTTELRFDIVA